MSSKGIRSNKLDLCYKCGKMFLKTRDTNVCPRCAPQKYLPEFKAQFRSPHVLLTKKDEPIKTVANGQKGKRWSLRYDHCVKCGRNDVEHRARGLCRNCYDRETEKRSRGKQRIGYGLASRKLDHKYLHEEYVKKKRSLSDIAKDCDCSRQYVFKKIVEFNIPLRTPSEARKVVFDRRKISYKYTDANGNERVVIQGGLKINKNFFKSWSKEMAYVLGVIYTDGNLFCDENRKIYRFIVSQKEPELLSKLLKLMDCNAQLRHRKKHGISGEIYLLDVHHPEMYHDLISLGLSPAKSKTIDFPNIPPEYVRHFIRGCWDGDGSIFTSGGRLRGSYACGSLKFIEGLIQEFYKVGIHKRKPPKDKIESDKMWLEYPDGRFPLRLHKEERSKSYEIKIDSRESLEKLFHYLYDGVDESLYLTRKYNVFVKDLKSEEKAEQLTLDLDSKQRGVIE